MGPLMNLVSLFFPPELFNVFFLICSSNRHQLMLKHWTSEPYKRPSWFIDKTPGRVFLASLLLKDATVIATETMTSPRVLSIKHLMLNKNKKKCVLSKTTNSTAVLFVKRKNNTLSLSVEHNTQLLEVLTMQSKEHMP